MDEHVIPECFVDTNLVETLVPPRGRYNHQHGCGAVTTLMKRRFGDDFALAIIDRDKHQVAYLNDFSLLSNKGSLLLHKHKTLHHYIIQINPAMERFMLDNAASHGLSMEDFDLLDELEALKSASKKANSKNDPRFKSLFRALIYSGAEDFTRLRNWITYLKAHPYNADSQQLTQF